MNYFKFGNSSKVFNDVGGYVHERLVLLWGEKHQKSGRKWKADLTWAKVRDLGITLMNGNILYWSKTLNV